MSETMLTLADLPGDLLHLITKRLPLASLTNLRTCAGHIGSLSTDSFITAMHVPLNQGLFGCSQDVSGRSRLGRMTNLTQVKIGYYPQLPEVEVYEEACELRLLAPRLLAMCGITTLTQLTVSCMYITAAVFCVDRMAASCPGLTRLEFLKLRKDWGDNSAVKLPVLWAAVSCIRGLRNLDVESDQLVLDGVQHLHSLHRLRIVEGDGTYTSSDRTKLQLSGLTALTQLETNLCGEWIAGVECLSSLVSLEHGGPWMDRQEADYNGHRVLLQQAAALPRLARLVMPRVHPRTPVLCGMTQLVELDMSMANVVVAECAALVSLTRLSCMLLQPSPAGSEMRMPALRSLEIMAFWSDDDVPGPPEFYVPEAVHVMLPALETLSLVRETRRRGYGWVGPDRTRDHAWWAALWPAGPPQGALRHLHELVLAEPLFNEAAAQVCGAIQRLSLLSPDVWVRKQLPAFGIVGRHVRDLELGRVGDPLLYDLVRCCPAVRSLVINDSERSRHGLADEQDPLTDDGIERLAEVPTLRDVTLSGTVHVTLRGVTMLAVQSRVERIVLDKCRYFRNSDAREVLQQAGRFWLDVMVIEDKGRFSWM